MSVIYFLAQRRSQQVDLRAADKAAAHKRGYSAFQYYGCCIPSSLSTFLRRGARMSVSGPKRALVSKSNMRMDITNKRPRISVMSSISFHTLISYNATVLKMVA